MRASGAALLIPPACLRGADGQEVRARELQNVASDRRLQVAREVPVRVIADVNRRGLVCRRRERHDDCIVVGEAATRGMLPWACTGKTRAGAAAYL